MQSNNNTNQKPINRKPRKLNTTTPILTIVFILAAFYLLFLGKKQIETATLPSSTPSIGSAQFKKTNVGVKYEHTSNAMFYSNNSEDFYFCTKDGIKYITSDGDEKWQHVFTMNTPTLIGEDRYVLVCEIKSNNISVFSPDGLVYTKQLDGAIQTASINRTGMACVIAKKDNSYKTITYDAKGNEIITIAHDTENIIPVSCDISNDGSVLAESLLDINGVVLRSVIEFRYLDSNKDQHTDALFASKEEKMELVGHVFYFDNGSLATFSDKKAQLYSIDEKHAIKSTAIITLKNKIDKIQQISPNSFAIAYGDNLTNTEPLKNGTVEIYDQTFIKTGEFIGTQKISYIWGSNNNVILGSNRTYHAVDFKGKVLWKFTGIQDYKQIIFMQNADTCLFAAATEANVMKRTGGK